MSFTRISFLTKRSRTELRHFIELSSIIENGRGSITDAQLADYLDVCHHHLRKPIETTSSKGEDAAEWNVWVLMGISGVRNESDAVRQKLDTCWPNVIKWAEVIVREYSSHKFFEGFCAAMGDLFHMLLVYGPTGFLEGRDIYDLAVDLWKGKDSLTGINIYTEAPLFVCLSEEFPWQLSRLLERTGYHPTQVVSTVVDRLKRTVDPLDPRDIYVSVCLLAKLTQAGKKEHPLSRAILDSEAPTTISSNLARLFPLKKESTEAQETIIHSMRFIKGYCELSECTERISELLHCGFLCNILETASMRHVEEADEIATSCLKTLILSLQSVVVVNSVMTGFCDLFSEERSIIKLVGQTSGTFTSFWETFEAILLEQSIIISLFEKGYACERGVCARQSCQTFADKRDFKKCRGCGFVLYCSKDCQKQDWKRHRIDCKYIGDEYEVDQKDESSRFHRRVAILHIRRYWPNILSMAETRGVPENRIGVHISFIKYPYEIGVFDYETFTNLGDGSMAHSSGRKFPYHAMVANEAFLRSTQGHRCVMLIITHPLSCQLPTLAHVEEEIVPSESEITQLLKNTAIHNQTRHDLLHYVDECGIVLFPLTLDIVSVARTMARFQLQNDSDAFWKESKFLGVVKKVLKVYRNVE